MQPVQERCRERSPSLSASVKLDKCIASSSLGSSARVAAASNAWGPGVPSKRRRLRRAERRRGRTNRCPLLGDAVGNHRGRWATGVGHGDHAGTTVGEALRTDDPDDTAHGATP